MNIDEFEVQVVWFNFEPTQVPHTLHVLNCLLDLALSPTLCNFENNCVSLAGPPKHHPIHGTIFDGLSWDSSPQRSKRRALLPAILKDAWPNFAELYPLANTRHVGFVVIMVITRFISLQSHLAYLIVRSVLCFANSVLRQFVSLCTSPYVDSYVDLLIWFEGSWATDPSRSCANLDTWPGHGLSHTGHFRGPRQGTNGYKRSNRRCESRKWHKRHRVHGTSWDVMGRHGTSWQQIGGVHDLSRIHLTKFDKYGPLLLLHVLCFQTRCAVVFDCALIFPKCVPIVPPEPAVMPLAICEIYRNSVSPFFCYSSYSSNLHVDGVQLSTCPRRWSWTWGRNNSSCRPQLTLR